MYIALALTLFGILAGRLCHHFPLAKPLKQIIFTAVLALLFLLGIQVGANDFLISHLHEMGLQALILTLLALAGSVAAVLLLQRVIGICQR